jgi:hypothetical protein
MPDIYALAAQRSSDIVREFRDRWLDGFEESASEYEFPRYASSPVNIFVSPWDLVDTLLREPKEPHAIYWHHPGSREVSNAMLFFTTDAHMLAGLTIVDDAPETLAHYLRELARSVGASFGYITLEEPPPETAEAFVARARLAPPPKLLEGSLVTDPAHRNGQ